MTKYWPSLTKQTKNYPSIDWILAKYWQNNGQVVIKLKTKKIEQIFRFDFHLDLPNLVRLLIFSFTRDQKKYLLSNNLFQVLTTKHFEHFDGFKEVRSNFAQPVLSLVRIEFS